MPQVPVHDVNSHKILGRKPLPGCRILMPVSCLIETGSPFFLCQIRLGNRFYARGMTETTAADYLSIAIGLSKLPLIGRQFSISASSS